MKFFIMIFGVIMVTGSAMAAETQPGETCTQAGLVRSTGGPYETVARTLICDGAVWRVVDEHSTAGKTLLQIGNDTGACNADKQGRLRFDGLNVEICNGTLWSELVAGAGSGGLRYAGMTPTSYTGNLGGLKGANEKCHAAFPNSRMMTTEDSMKVSRQMPAGAGWVQCSVLIYNGSSAINCGTVPVPVSYASSLGLTCGGWADSTPSYYGLRYDNTGAGTWTPVSCSATHPVHCVYD